MQFSERQLQKRASRGDFFDKREGVVIHFECSGAVCDKHTVAAPPVLSSRPAAHSFAVAA